MWAIPALMGIILVYCETPSLGLQIIVYLCGLSLLLIAAIGSGALGARGSRWSAGRCAPREDGRSAGSAGR